MRAEGIAVVAVPGAADDEDVPRRLVDAALGHFGRIDLLVNTVGGATYQGSALDIDRASLLDTLALNTWPTLALIQEAVGRGLADGGGAIVNVSSGSPKKTTPSMAAYAAGKAALNALTRTLANDLGPRGIRVNAVSPGLTMTSATRPMWDADGGSAAGERLLLGRLTEADGHRGGHRLPVGRRGAVHHRRAPGCGRRQPRVVRILVAAHGLVR